MIIAERYILTRIVKIAGMTLGSLLVLVLMSQVLVFVNVVTDSGEAIWTFVSLAFLLVPSVGNIILPFALLIGICHTFNTMHTESEIIVMEAAGTSRAVQIRPVMLLATFLSAATLANTLVLEPYANRHLRDVITSSGSNLVRFAIRSGTFHRLEKDLFIEIAGQLPGGGFQGIMIIDVRDPQTELIHYAKRGQTTSHDEQEILLLSDGEVHRRNARTGDVSIISFSTYALDFATFRAPQGTSSYYPKERPTAELLFPDPSDSQYQKQPHRFRSELHRRLSDWLYPPAFALIALYFSVGARSHRQERLWAIAGAAGTALAFRSGGFMVIGEAGRNVVNTALAYLIPSSAIAIFGYLLITGRQAVMSQKSIDRLAALAERLQSARSRLEPARPSGGTAPR